jgi:hypothetical protein
MEQPPAAPKASREFAKSHGRSTAKGNRSKIYAFSHAAIAK